MAKELDKFYTKAEIAKQCVNYALPYLQNKIIIEPSAGNGRFLDALEFYNLCYNALDIKPEDSKNRVVKQNFYDLVLDFDSNIAVIGNPPFGKRTKEAINFFNHAAKFADVIAFIMPVSAMKWSVQKELSSDFNLVEYHYLPVNSFTVEEEDYSIRTVFQIWMKNSDKKDLRLKKSPPIKHPDFNLWQYNATKEAYSAVNENWKYATYRQGYRDYNRLFTQNDKDEIKEMMGGDDYEWINGRKNKAIKKKLIQFFFIEPLTEQAENNILKMDFNALADRNTITPGFGKADFISYYKELFDR